MQKKQLTTEYGRTEEEERELRQDRQQGLALLTPPPPMMINILGKRTRCVFAHLRRGD